jgi:hypothetical protein
MKKWIGYGVTSDGVHVTMIGDLPRAEALEVLSEWNANPAGRVFRLVDLFASPREEEEA